MSITALYRDTTGDVAAHPRSIAAHLAKLDPRRQALIRARAEGKTWAQIAEPLGIDRASVRSAVTGGLRAVRKALRNEPRYNATGRKPRATRRRQIPVGN